MSEAKKNEVPVDIEALVKEVVDSALDRKALDLRVLHLGQVTDFTDYFLVLSGTNERQVQAVSNGIGRRTRDLGLRPLHVEGFRNGQWILMDYGDFVVHLFLEDVRGFYGLERLWSDAPDVTEQFLPPCPPAQP